MMNILLVETDGLQGLTLRAVLEQAGHRIHWARTEQAALSSAGPFEFVICDGRLRRGDDFPVVQSYAGQGVPVLLITHTDRFKIRDDCRAVACLEKPFTGPQLLEAINVVVTVVSGGNHPNSSLKNFRLFNQTP